MKNKINQYRINNVFVTSASPPRMAKIPVIIGFLVILYGPSTIKCLVAAHGASVPFPILLNSTIVQMARNNPVANSNNHAIV